MLPNELQGHFYSEFILYFKLHLISHSYKFIQLVLIVYVSVVKTR